MRKVIITSILLLGISLISAQTSDCDSLIIKIKEMAERHVNQNKEMTAETPVAAYGDNLCGLNKAQIIEIYETHYESTKNKSSNIWNKFKPEKDWFYFVLIFLLGIFVKGIREWIAKIFKNIGSSLYSRFSGKRIFRGKAIKKYKESLFNNYKEVKIPFRPGKPLNMADIFIPLNVIDNAEKNQLEIEQAISLYKKSVVVGDPGSGKSMFCKNILFKYSKNQLKYTKIPVLVELHRLSEKSLDIVTLLENEFKNNDFPNSSKFLSQCLKSGDLLILFDGYDEINSKERSRVTLLVNDFIKKNSKCQYVITSRIAVYKDEFKDVTEKKLKLIDFDQQQIRKFLNSWSTEMPDGKSIEQLMKILQDRPNILLLATNPLMLTIIAYMHTDTHHILPHSRSEFYEQATNVLLGPKQGFNNKYDAREKSLILQHLALNSLEESLDKEQDRKLIHFTKVFEEIKKILPKINRLENDIQSILEEIVERSGLLLTVDNGEYYQFAHLTMQEYFAAKQLIDKQEELLLKFENDNDTWRETIKLWCGLANDTTSMISELYEIDPVIAFECIADARSIEPEIADKIIARFEELLSDPTKCSVKIEKAFGVLASDARSGGRGQDILEKLKLKIETSGTKEQIITIANALSYTYLPKAASIISTYCVKDQQLYDCLIRMGDIAVDELLKLSKCNDTNALFGLKKISTPRAALALLSLIWDENEISRYAAWFLADIIFTPNITNALRESALTPAQLKRKSHDWVWEPFKTQEPLDSNFSFIIGRIVYLMSLSIPIDFKQEISLAIDGRIAIPVVINQYPSLKKESWEFDDIIQRNKLGLCKEEINLMKQEHSGLKDFFWDDLPYYLRRNNRTTKQIKVNDSSFLIKFIDRKKYPIFFMVPIFWLSKIFKIFTSEHSFGTKDDWINLSRTNPKQYYNFDTSWHYRIIFALFTILSVSSIIFCVYSIWQSEHFFTTWNIIQSIGVLLMLYNVIVYSFFDTDSEGEFYGDAQNLLRNGVLGFFALLFMAIDNPRECVRHSSLLIWGTFLFYYNYLLLRLFLPITGVLLVAIVIIGTCILLSVIGNKLERISRNPFKSLKEVLLPEKTKEEILKYAKKRKK